MISGWELPTSLNIGGVGFLIRTDFRAILDILKACADPDLSDEEKLEVMLYILYVDADQIPQENIEEALIKANEFIDAGIKKTDRASPRVMDWEQDVTLIASAVSKTLGRDIRYPQETHWWEFLRGYFEIRESLFSEVISIRMKKAKGQKLEKAEREFYLNNQSMIDLKKKVSDEEAEIIKEWM